MPFLSLPDFADKLNQIMPVLMREFTRVQPAEVYKGKVTLPQILILQHLSSGDSVKMTDIANFMKVTTSAVTGIVDRLVKSGYVLRVFDQKDRRIIKVKITLKGSILMKKLAYDRRKLVINIFSKISEQDRQDYLRILMRIQDALSGE
jgi:DNA-binding MarR family transcriptional regulator